MVHVSSRDRSDSGAALGSVSAAILAGGQGTRLRAVVSDRPKVLADVGGRPFLAYLLDVLAKHGGREVVICTGYRAEQVRQALGDSYAGMRLVYSQESEPLGTGGGLRLALPHLASEDVLVMNGDSYCEADLGEFVRFHRSRAPRPTASLVVVHVKDAGRYGSVAIDSGGRVARFEEKGSPRAGWINAGIYLMARDLVAEIPGGRPVSLEREVFPGWVERGIYAYRSPGPFIDIGAPESYQEAQSFFGAGKSG
jgi:NDP-sugar pyrophosphorylase family protein